MKYVEMTLLIEVRGGPHEVFRPREGGLTRIRCFRVVPWHVVVKIQKSFKTDSIWLKMKKLFFIDRWENDSKNQ